MDLSRDELRRHARALDEGHDGAMRGMRAALHRVFSTDAAADAKAGAVIDGLDRRGFLRFGGATIATASVMAACGGGGNGAQPAESTTTTAPGTPGDIAILRTASSLEEVAVAFYQRAIDSKLLTTVPIADLAKRFQAHHGDHSDVMQQATRDLGGTPFGEANPRVLDELKPSMDAALATEAGIVAFAVRLERIAAATYQDNVSRLDDLALAEPIMSIGAIEARHAAMFAVLSRAEALPDGAFQKTDLALKGSATPA